MSAADEATFALRDWCVQLSDMIGGDLTEDASLEEGLEWFGGLDDETLAGIRKLGIDNPAIAKFNATGPLLMKSLGIGT